MTKKLVLSIFILLLLTTNGMAQTNQQVQVFDITKGKVVKVVQMNPNVYQEAEIFLSGITGVYVKYNPIPNEGLMIRIPLEPSVLIKNEWLESLVDEVTIIFSGREKPYLMVFDDENRHHFFLFKGDTYSLLKLLHFEP